MATRFKTVLYTLTGSPVSLNTILGSANDLYVSSITLRAGSSNAGTITWTSSDAGATAGGYLDAGEAATFDVTGKFVSLNDIKLDGTLNDTVYLTFLG